MLPDRMEGSSLFPHPQMRNGQRSFYKDANFATEGGKILFANAPTGIGKTAASLCGVLESALPAGRKTVFLTHRNSHHIQAMIECRSIIRNRSGALEKLRPQAPSLRVVDKISKARMCLLRARDPTDDSPYLLCEIAHCKFSRPRPSVSDSLLREPMGASESVARSLLGEGYCAHYAALGAMKDADVAVCDYSYLFEAGILDLFLSRLGRQLSDCDVIIDEAHNLPDRIMDINARQIGEKTLKNAQRALGDARRHAEEAPEMLAQINLASGYFKSSLSPALKMLVGGSEASAGEKRLSREELAAFHPGRFSKHGLSSLFGIGEGARLSVMLGDITEFLRLRALKEEGARLDVDGMSGLAELAAFLDSAEKAATGNPAYGVFIKTSEDREFFRIRTALFDPSLVSSRVFSEVHSAVLMSGTLIGKRGLCDLLGIDSARAMMLGEGAYESPFDAERKRVRACDWVSSRQRERADGRRVKVMAAIIDEAARACAPHSLAVFYPSYEYLRMVKDELVLSGFRHETEMRREKHAAVEERKGRIEARTFDEKPIVFHGVIGGSYSEGMDFRNNPFKLIVLAGFPFPKPDARHEAYEGYLAGKFKSETRAAELASVLPACIKTVQAMGRGIRKAEDWCYCLLIDDRFLKYGGHLQPALGGRMETVAGSQKRKIYEDIARFIEQMEKKPTTHA